jgi:hypothetical protein
MVVPFSNASATFGAQLLGAATIFGWVFVVSLVVWSLLKATMGLRVSEEEEMMGVDVHECGVDAYPEFVSIKSSIARHLLAGPGDTSGPVFWRPQRPLKAVVSLAIVARGQPMLALEGGGEVVLVLEAALLGQQLHRVGPARQQSAALQPQPLQQRHGGQREVLLTEPMELTLERCRAPAMRVRACPRLGQRFFEQQFEAQRQLLATTLPLPFAAGGAGKSRAAPPAAH